MSEKIGPPPIRFSIAIPNYNYGHYLGPTIQSVLDQGDPDVEIVISDNASTDDSVAVVKSFGDPRLHLHVNPVNVGFANNLDRAVGPTTGSHVILLSSDDIMNPGALASYRALLEKCDHPANTVLTATYDVIGPESERITTFRWPSALVDTQVLDRRLSRLVGAPVIEASCRSMLTWGMQMMRNPLPFAPTCFPRGAWEAVGGYGGDRAMNPDMWFHWRLLATVGQVFIIDSPLFAYRVHSGGQTNATKLTGALKLMMDDYAYTFQASDEMLAFAGVERRELERAFVRHDGAARALATLVNTSRREARRYVNFAAAVYPEHAHRDLWWWAARTLVAIPGGQMIAARLLKNLPKLMALRPRSS